MSDPWAGDDKYLENCFFLLLKKGPRKWRVWFLGWECQNMRKVITYFIQKNVPRKWRVWSLGWECQNMRKFITYFFQKSVLSAQVSDPSLSWHAFLNETRDRFSYILVLSAKYQTRQFRGTLFWMKYVITFRIFWHSQPKDQTRPKIRPLTFGALSEQ